MEEVGSRKAYLRINLLFTGVILLIMGYSAFFSPSEDKYPVICIHEKITGQQCPSCGLSHAFSLIVRGRIDEALEYNYASLRVFSFFAVQLIMRISVALWLSLSGRKISRLVIADSAISALMALWAFFPYLKATWHMIFNH